MNKALIAVIFIFAESLVSAQDTTLLFGQKDLVYSVAFPLDSISYEFKIIRRANFDFYYWQIDGDTLVRDSSGIFSGKKFSMIRKENGFELRRNRFLASRTMLAVESECSKRVVFILNKFQFLEDKKQLFEYCLTDIGYSGSSEVYSKTLMQFKDSALKNTCYWDMKVQLEIQKEWAVVITDSIYQAKAFKLRSIQKGKFDQTPGSVQKILCSLGDSNLDAEMLSCLILNYTDLFVQACVLMTEPEFDKLTNKFYSFPESIDVKKLIEALNNSGILWNKKGDYIKELKRIARFSHRWNK